MSFKRAATIFLSLALLAAACIISFRNGLSNWFAFDDHLAIVDNGDTAPEAPYSNLWKNDIWGKGLEKEDSHRSFRPLLILVFKLIRTVYGLSPYHFRFVSIVLHILATFMVFWLSFVITCSQSEAFGSALLFATHPVHVESVTAVVNLAEPFSCIAYISAYLMFLRLYRGPRIADQYFRVQGENASAKQVESGQGLISFILGGSVWILVVFVGILLKESALSICGMIIAKIGIDAFSWAASRARSNGSSDSISIISFVKYLIMYAFANIYWCAMPFIVVMLYVLLRDIVITGSISTTTIFSIPIPSFSLSNSYLNNSQLLRRAENPFAELVGNEKAMSLMYLHFRYFWVLLWPKELCAEYAFDCIPKIKSPYEIRFYYTISFYGSFLALIFFGIYKIVSHSSYSTRDAKNENQEKEGHLKEDKATSDVNNKLVTRNQALITVLAWFVVSFVPASGVFLKLGTLLAERLLYIPSVAYCILLSMTISAIFKNLCNVVKVRNLTVLLYLITILGISILYSWRTINYNPAWADDTTLFRHSLTVCPRSAKLQLQLAKLNLNEKRFEEAIVHVNNAKEIDPEFCDIGYQEALIAVLYHNDLEGGLELAAGNLKCIYTSKQSFELFNKLLEQEQQMYPNSLDVHIRHADLMAKHDLAALAAKKYQFAANQAYNAKKYKLALQLNKKAYKLIPSFMKDSIGAEESQANGITDLACSIALYGGAWRLDLMEKKPGSSFSLSEKEGELAREQLLSVVIPSCVIVDSSAKKIVSNSAKLALNAVSHYLVKSFKDGNVTLIEEYASFAEKASLVLMKIDIIDSLVPDTSNNQIKVSKTESNEQAIYLASLATHQLYFSAGKLHFKEGNYILAADRLKRSLSLEFKIDGAPFFDAVPIFEGYSYNFFSWYSEIKKIHSEKLTYSPEKDPIFVLYWYVQAVASRPEFLDSEILLKEVVGSLRAIDDKWNARLPKKGSKSKINSAEVNVDIEEVVELSRNQLKSLEEFCKTSNICPVDLFQH